MRLRSVGAVIDYSRGHFALCAVFTLVALGAIWMAPQPNTKTYTHVAVVTDGMGWPGTGLEWRIHDDTLWVFLK